MWGGVAFRAPPKGSSVQAFAPLFPGPRQERWYFCLADTPRNATFAVQPESLLAAEAAGVVSALSNTPGSHEHGNSDGVLARAFICRLLQDVE